MNLFTIDKSKPIPELDLSLHKPSEEHIGNLTDAYSRNATLSFGQYNELTLTIPKYVMRKHNRVRNKNYDNIRERYLVKANYGNIFSEWLMVTKVSKGKSKTPEKKITLKSRQYELNDKRIRNYEVESYSPKQVFEDALRYTNWTIGEIDLEFDEKYRAFSETNTTSLNLLYKIAETFVGVLVFDTFQKTVSLRKQENVELDLGLTASYGKYLKSVDQDSDAEKMVTRLYVYGKDDLSINDMNPTGTAYLEDFSYFMAGYATDDNGNVVSSSPYMTDGLCQAVIDYNKLLDEKDGAFRSLLDEREPIQDEWIERLNEYYMLEIDLLMIEDSLDINKAAGLPTDELKEERDAKQDEIDNKQDEVDELELQLTLIDNDIQDLQEILAMENNFTKEQIEERNYFIIEGEWTDRNYFQSEDLYEAGKEKIKESNEPEKTLDFDLVQFLQVVEAQRDWNRIGLGYVIRVDYEPIDIEFKAIISELKIGFDDRSLNITVSNVDYKSSKKKFAEMLYSTAVSTSQKVDQGSLKWDESANKTTEMEEILEGTWDASARRISAGVNESVTVDRRGIKIINPDFPNEMLVANAGVLALSLDGGENWKTAIRPDGIVSERMTSKTIKTLDTSL